MKYGYGIDLGGTTVKLARFREDGSLLKKWEIATARDGSRILPEIAQSVLEDMEASGIGKAEVLGVGVGVPGPVNGLGVVEQCVNLHWGRKDVRRELEALTGLSVSVGNDANVAALGEAAFGGDSMVMVTLGTGIGGGIIVNGRIVHGFHGAGGEIGHIPLNPQEPERCACGKRGCAEQYCSATGVVRLAKRRLAESIAPSSLRSLETITCKAVFDAAGAGDPLAMSAVDQACDYLARLIATVCCTVDPETVVLGGGVSRAGELLLTGLRRHFPDYVFPACKARFALAQLGNDAGVYGAFRLAAGV